MDDKKKEKPRLKHLNVDFKTPEELALLKRLRVKAAESELMIREAVIRALQGFVTEEEGKK